ncbi:MAG: WG repeat-containing protein [Roseivirga sp.]|nr:WG repeat-containing protein [Roseivirga sp.]
MKPRMYHFRLFLILFLLSTQGALLADQFEPFSEGGRVGLKNITTNTIAIPPKFEGLGWSDKSFSVVNGVIGALQNERWALVNTEGNRITEHYFNTLVPSSEDNFIASKRDNSSILTNYGLIDSNGKTIINFVFSSMQRHSAGLIVSEKKGAKYLRGFISEKGKSIIPIAYDAISELSKTHLIVSKDGLLAVFDTDGNQLTEFLFEYIEPHGNTYYKIGKYNHQGLLSNTIELVIPPLYKNLVFGKDQVEAIPYTQWDFFKTSNYSATYYFDDINFLDQEAFATSAGRKTGSINYKGEYYSFLPEERLVESNEKVFVTTTRSGRYKAYNSQGKPLFRDSFEEIQLQTNLIFTKNSQADGHSWSIHNLEGKKLNLFNYQHIEKKSESFFQAKRNDKIGLIGKDGKEISPFLYDQLSAFKNERAIALYNNGYGVVNSNGLWIMTPYYDSLSIDNNYLYFRQGTEYGVADLFGKVLYRDQSPFEPLAEAIIKSNEDSSKSIFSMYGEQLLEHSYDSITALSTQLLFIRRDNQSFIFRPSDKYVLKLENDIEHIEPMKADYMPVLKGGQWGFLNSDGRITIANRYEAVGQFSEGLFSVKLIGKWGFVNKNEELIIQPNFDQVSPFDNGLSIVKSDSKWGLINTSGKEVIALNYDSVKRLGSYFVIESNDQVGLADSRGKIIKNPSFDSIKALENNYFLVERNGFYGVINEAGHDVIPTIYKTVKQSGDMFLASKEGEKRTFQLK